MPAISSRREKSAITGSDPSCFSSRPAPAICARGRRAPRRGSSDTPIDQQRTSRTLATQVTQSHVRTTGLAGFVVLTIAGERLELAHVGRTNLAQSWFVAAAAGVLAGAVASLLWPRPGHHVWGLALLGLVGWLAVFDVARRTIRGRGLPRYVAAGLLAGYGWLALAGLLWAGAGATTDGPRYDATLHAVFLGFTMSMIFVHAPVILPAVLRRPLPYRPVLYAPLGLLHLSLAARLGLGDAAGLTAVWRWAGVANAVAVVAFAPCAAALAVRAGRASRTARSTAAADAPVAVRT